jgi:two-component system, NtrC family, sensor histidine kinase HydH
LRTFARIAVVLVALAGILGLSVSSALREQERLVDEFTMATRQQVHASVEALSARLDALDQDTRTLTDLVEHSRSTQGSDPAIEHRVWDSAFRALATVVAQYRVIALVDGAGRVEVLAADPTETPATVEALSPDTRRLALEVSAKRARALGQTARHGTRSFLLYGTPVRGGGAIVVACDAAIFLGAVAFTPLPAARLFVTDPAGVVWAGCETQAGCQSRPSDAVDKDLEVTPRPVAYVGARGARIVRSARIPAVQVFERLDRPTGSWVVTWLASTQPIVQRQQSVVARVVLTAMAAALAVAAIGAAILRQQRKAVELEGQLRTAQTLANARETSQSIVENAPLGVLGVSHDGRVVLANGFLTERLGPVVLGAPLCEAFSGDGAVWVRDLEGLLLGALPAGKGEVAPLELRPLAAGPHQFHVRIVPVRNRDLGVRAFALVEDQSALRNLENQLVRAEKLITVGVLSAGIAHEIGSPLAVIRGRAEQVLRAAGDGPRAEDLRVIIKHIDNITSILGQVLDFSRKQPIERQAVAVDGAIERARALLRWKLDARSVELAVELDDELPALAADPDQLQQVLVNLLLNACDASSQGGRVTVTAHATREGQVRVEIADVGCGIAPEHMNAVFDPFFTTKKRGEGTGLGLPIATSIVRNHGGQINLRSTPGKGTTVSLTWPPASQQKQAAHG